jgi:hypothetical protein
LALGFRLLAKGFCRPYGTQLSYCLYPGFREQKPLAPSGANIFRPYGASWLRNSDVLPQSMAKSQLRANSTLSQPDKTEKKAVTIFATVEPAQGKQIQEPLRRSACSRAMDPFAGTSGASHQQPIFAHARRRSQMNFSSYCLRPVRAGSPCSS